MTSSGAAYPLVGHKAVAALGGAIEIPGDKSISHRALIFGALAVGRTTVVGLLEGEDVLSTASALRRLGVGLDRTGPGTWTVDGVGVGGFAEPAEILDLGNAGTGARLLMGALTGAPVVAVFTGDASLRRRPMARVTRPLELMGARVMAREGVRLPLALAGTGRPRPLRHVAEMASAQVKSAILLAGLAAPGLTEVIEREPTRDHTERLLRHFGAEIHVEETAEGRVAAVLGERELVAAHLAVPGDPSSAAFAAVAALVVPGSDVTLRGVSTNPLRTGLYETLREMGAEIALTGEREAAGEPVADLRVRHLRCLRGVTVPAERAPRMIDEYPILAVAAALAEGRTVMHGLGELRVKESDRLTAMAAGLAACGVRVEVDGDTLIVEGTGGRAPPGGARIAANLDHRIAMSFLVLGLASAAPVAIDDAATIETSFPGFVATMGALGAAIAPPGA